MRIAILKLIKYSILILSIGFAEAPPTQEATWKIQSTSLQDISSIKFTSHGSKLFFYRTCFTQTDLYQINVTTGKYHWVARGMPFHAGRVVFWEDENLLWCMGHSVGKSGLALWSSLDGQTWTEIQEVEFPSARHKQIPNHNFFRNGSLWVFFDGAIMRSVDKKYLKWDVITNEFPWEKGYSFPWQTKEYLWVFGMSARNINMSIWYSEDGVHWIRPSYLFNFPMVWGFSLEADSSDGFFVYGGKYLLPKRRRESVYVKNTMSANPVRRENAVPWTNLYGLRSFRLGDNFVLGGGRSVHSGVENNQIWIRDAKGWRECSSDSPMDTKWVDILWDGKKNHFWILAAGTGEQGILFAHNGKEFRNMGKIQAKNVQQSKLILFNDELFLLESTAKTKFLRGEISAQKLSIVNNDITLDDQKIALGKRVLQNLVWASHQGQNYFYDVASGKKSGLFSISSQAERVQNYLVPDLLGPQTKLFSYKNHLWLAGSKVYKSIDGLVWEEVFVQGYEREQGDVLLFYGDKLILYSTQKLIVSEDGVEWKKFSFPRRENFISIGVCSVVGKDLLNFSLEDFTGERSWYRWSNFPDIFKEKEAEIVPAK